MIFENIFQSLVFWALSHGIKILVILIGTYLITTRFVRVFIIKITKGIIKRTYKVQGTKDGKIRKTREKTLVEVFTSTINFVIWAIAILTILPEFGINIGPLLASAGILGLAIGMGSRSLISDYISGLFILIEDQYRVGEEVEIAGVRGKVKSLSLRRTILKNQEGTIFYIPNGQVTKVSNLSRGKK